MKWKAAHLTWLTIIDRSITITWLIWAKKFLSLTMVATLSESAQLRKMWECFTNFKVSLTLMRTKMMTTKPVTLTIVQNRWTTTITKKMKKLSRNSLICKTLILKVIQYRLDRKERGRTTTLKNSWIGDSWRDRRKQSLVIIIAVLLTPVAHLPSRTTCRSNLTKSRGNFSGGE